MLYGKILKVIIMTKINFKRFNWLLYKLYEKKTVKIFSKNFLIINIPTIF